MKFISERINWGLSSARFVGGSSTLKFYLTLFGLVEYKGWLSSGFLKKIEPWGSLRNPSSRLQNLNIHSSTERLDCIDSTSIIVFDHKWLVHHSTSEHGRSLFCVIVDQSNEANHKSLCLLERCALGHSNKNCEKDWIWTVKLIKKQE